MGRKKFSKEKLRHSRYIIFLLFLVILYMAEAAALYRLLFYPMENEFLKWALIIVIIVVMSFETHYFVKVAERAGRFEEKCRSTNSFAIHLCHKDPETTFIVRKRPLPLCARHLGFYIGLGFFAIVAIFNFYIWLDVLQFLGLPIYVVLTVFCLLVVPLHGTLTRYYGWKKQKIARFIAGFINAWAWFLLTAIILHII